MDLHLHKAKHTSNKPQKVQEEQEIMNHHCTLCDYESPFLGNVWIHTAQKHAKELPIRTLKHNSDIEVLMLLLVEQNFQFEDNVRLSSLETKDMFEEQNKVLEKLNMKTCKHEERLINYIEEK